LRNTGKNFGITGRGKECKRRKERKDCRIRKESGTGNAGQSGL
jgi:hypothetical protein